MAWAGARRSGSLATAVIGRCGRSRGNTEAPVLRANASGQREFRSVQRGYAATSSNLADGVPVIDLSELVAAPSLASLHADMAAVSAIRDACSTWGFFQVVNHGVSPTDLSRFEQTMKEFFAQPRELKAAIKRTSTNSKGWYDDELTKNRVDWKQGFDIGAQDGSLDKKGLDGWNQWPVAPADFEQTVRKHFVLMEGLAARLTGAMALGLGLPPTFFAKEFDGCHSSYLRLNYYPPCDQLPEGIETSRPTASVWDNTDGDPNPDPWSISHHTDAGAVTVLLQTEVQSLQVYQPDDETWYDVAPQPGAFVINTGDIMQVWSNDMYKAPLHRVKAHRSLERWSTPFFYNPSYETDYAPVVADQEPKYRPINWGEFRLGRFQGDYADVGTEVQVTDFSIKLSIMYRFGSHLQKMRLIVVCLHAQIEHYRLDAAAASS